MAESVTNPIRTPFPPEDFPMQEADGRLTQVWREFFMRLFARTGSAPGVDSTAVSGQVDALQKLVDEHTLQISDLYLLASEPSGIQMFAAMLSRISALEGQSMTHVVALPHLREVSLPEPVQAPQKASDDLRKLMEMI